MSEEQVFAVPWATDRHKVFISDHGIRVGDGSSIPWSVITGLRDRPTRRRIEVLQGDQPVVSLRYDLNDLQLVVDLVMKRMRGEDRSWPRSIAARHAMLTVVGFSVVMAAVCGVCVWVAIATDSWLLWIVALFFAWMLIEDLRKKVLRIDFGDHAITIRTALGRQEIPRSEVRAFDVLVMPDSVDAIALLEPKRVVELKLAGVDPFFIHRAALAAYPDL